MAKFSHSHKVLSEIELFLDVGKCDDARVLLTFLDDTAFDRESRLRLLLVNVTLDGAAAYKDEIAELAALPDLTEREKGIVEKISFLERRSPDENPRQDFQAGRGASPPGPSRSFHAAVDQTKLLEDREAELKIFKETIRSLEQRLSEKQQSLEGRDAEVAALRSQVTELRMRLTESAQAKDREVGRLREELARRNDLLQAREMGLAELQVRSAEQIHALKARLEENDGILAARNAELDLCKTRVDRLVKENERIRGLETQLGEAKTLLAARDGELDSVKASLNELMREKADWISAQELADRAIEKARREQAELAQIMETSLAAVEEQRGAQIRLLELQLGEKQNLLNTSRAELEDMRREISLLNQRATEAEAAKLQDETPPREEPKSASRIWPAIFSAKDPPAIWRGSGVGWQELLRLIFPATWNSTALSKALLPIAAAALLTLPIGFYLASDARMAMRSDAPARVETAGFWTPESEPAADDERGEPAETAPELSDDKARKGDAASGRKLKTAKGNLQAAAGYITRRAVPLREQPRYAAKAKAQIGPGTPVTVLDTQGSWLRVETPRSGIVGYVRREYLVHANSSR